MCSSRKPLCSAHAWRAAAQRFAPRFCVPASTATMSAVYAVRINPAAAFSR